MKPIRVLIVEDHALLRQGLRALLKRQKGIDLVGEAADGPHALDMVDALKPDVVLLDIRMPEMDRLHVLPELLEKSPGTKVLILTASLDYDLVATALEQGAKGYLTKTARPESLVRAVRAVHAGELWAERKVQARFIEGLLRNISCPDSRVRSLGTVLTKREKEVAKWVIQGMTNKEIATKLMVSDKTVKAHLSSVFRKLNIRRRLELLVYQPPDRVHQPGSAAPHI